MRVPRSKTTTRQECASYSYDGREREHQQAECGKSAPPTPPMAMSVSINSKTAIHIETGKSTPPTPTMAMIVNISTAQNA